jgi:predicted RNA-binding protein with PIN domain
MSHAHENGNNKHTLADLMEHEMEKFSAQLNQLTLDILVGTTFTPLKHCQKCEGAENVYTKKMLDDMNKKLKKINKEIEKLHEDMENRVKVLYPRVILIHPEFLEEETPPATPADSSK